MPDGHWTSSPAPRRRRAQSAHRRAKTRHTRGARHRPHLVADDDARADAVAVRFGRRPIGRSASGFRRGALVLPQLGGAHRAPDDDVEAAVAVEVGDATPAVRGHRGGSPASARRHGTPLPVVEEQAVGLLPSAASKSPMRSFACEFAVKMSFQPSLSKSARPCTIRTILTVSPPRPLDCVVSMKPPCRSLRKSGKVSPEQRGEVDVLPAVVVVVLEVGAHAGHRTARCRAPTRRPAARSPRTCRRRCCGTGSSARCRW